jgi:hypothetical protein
MTPTTASPKALSCCATNNVPSEANAIPETLLPVLSVREGRDDPGGITRIPPVP